MAGSLPVTTQTGNVYVKVKAFKTKQVLSPLFALVAHVQHRLEAQRLSDEVCQTAPAVWWQPETLALFVG